MTKQRFDSLVPAQPQGMQPAMQTPPVHPGMWRDTPVRALSVQSDVIVPLLWAVIVSIAIGAGVYYVTEAWDVTWFAFGATLLLVLIVGVLYASKSVYAHEWPQDLPTPWFPPQVQESREGTVVINATHGRAELERIEHEDRLQRVWAFLQGCERNTDWRFWAEQYDSTGKRLISERDYRRLRDGLFAAGLAVKDNPRQSTSGWHLVKSAEETYRHIYYWDDTAD